MPDDHNTSFTDTLGWDTVFAIPIPAVNEAIKKNKSSPPRFSFANGKGDAVMGDFGTWQITQGGDGPLLWLSLPVAALQGSLCARAFQWEQGTLIIEVRLQYIPHTEAAKGRPGVRQYRLKVRSRSSNPADPVVTVKDTIWTIDPKGEAVEEFGAGVVKAAISALIDGWLNENLEQFTHVFATVNLNEYLDKDVTWAWTKPTHADYAYSDGSALQTSMLGVLCMTGGRIAGLRQIRQIDRYVIPEKSVAGFLISQERLLEDLMLPTLPLHWKTSSGADYETVQQGDTDIGKYEYILRLKPRHSVRLDPVTHEARTYTPYMKRMTISLEECEIIFETYTETDIGMGVTAFCKTTHWYNIDLGISGNTQTLVYRELRAPRCEHGTTESTRTEVEKALIILAGIVATAVLAVVTGGAALAVGGMIIGLLTGVAATSPEIISAVNSNVSPGMDLLTFNCTAPITWNSSSVFELDCAGINGPLQLGGNPHFNQST